MAAGIAVVILTHNEEKHLARALRSVVPLAHTIHVVDSGSVDGTVDIARSFGAQVLSHPWKNYADQFQWAVDNITTDAHWILRLDADEMIEPEFVRRIIDAIPNMPDDVSGVTVKLRYIFQGRLIRHGDRTLTLLRVFRRGRARIEQRWMDEHIHITSGRTVHLAGGYFFDSNLNDLTFFIDKHNKYATREALDVFFRRRGLDLQDSKISAGAAGRNVAMKRWIKERVYNYLPIWVGPVSYFLYRYIVKFGFLDGREAFVYHVLQGFWYRFLVAAKVLEFERAVVGMREPADIRRKLSELTGQTFSDL